MPAHFTFLVRSMLWPPHYYGVETAHVVMHIGSCWGGEGMEGMLTVLACSMLGHVGIP